MSVPDCKDCATGANWPKSQSYLRFILSMSGLSLLLILWIYGLFTDHMQLSLVFLGISVALFFYTMLGKEIRLKSWRAVWRESDGSMHVHTYRAKEPPYATIRSSIKRMHKPLVLIYHYGWGAHPVRFHVLFPRADILVAMQTAVWFQNSHWKLAVHNSKVLGIECGPIRFSADSMRLPYQEGWTRLDHELCYYLDIMEKFPDGLSHSRDMAPGAVSVCHNTLQRLVEVAFTARLNGGEAHSATAHSSAEQTIGEILITVPAWRETVRKALNSHTEQLTDYGRSADSAEYKQVQDHMLHALHLTQPVELDAAG